MTFRRLVVKIGYVKAFTREPRVHGVIDSLTTTRGATTVLLTDNPTLDQPDCFYTYVALAAWLPADQPVAMFVTFMAVNARREVNLVYAPPVVRFDGDFEDDVSVPVQIGRWLFSNGHLTHHSVDRTPEGDRWARAVGGVLPPLAAEDDPHRGSPEATTRSATRAYEALCTTDWTGHWGVP